LNNINGVDVQISWIDPICNIRKEYESNPLLDGQKYRNKQILTPGEKKEEIVNFNGVSLEDSKTPKNIPITQNTNNGESHTH